ncbi:MAG: hypothetical protein C5B60_01515 [Chloroflexi bacterium]|nr:MAG: hypothetical protein C5B60_01515 [Chloroflexota bacterium]
MALLTAGTSTTTVLRALQWNRNMNPTDLAALHALCTLSYTSANPAYNPGMVFDRGMVYYPNRGALRLFDGDYIIADPVSGFYWPVNGAAFTGGSFVHS